jgi:hypothetical protein
MAKFKDPSSLHIADPSAFMARWTAILAAAVPWTQQAQAQQAEETADLLKLAYELLHDPKLMERIKEAIRARGYAGDLTPPTLIYLVMTSRLLERPQNAAAVAASGAGKNAAIDAPAELMPTEALYKMTAGSPRALIYAKEEFEHRVVIVQEADSIPEDGPAASAIRSLAADNSMEYDVVVRDESTGGFRTMHIRKRGPTGLLTTSTRSLKNQMGTRVLEIPIRDDEEQTRAVMDAHADTVMPRTLPVIDVEPFHAAQRYLALAGEKRVAVPFARALAKLVPAGAVRMRRDFRQLLTCVQSVAFLYQLQRGRTAEGWVEATLEDYAIARDLLAPIFDAVAADGVTPAVRATAEAVKPGEEVSESELATRLGLAKSTVHYRVQRAITGGWLVNREHRDGHPYKLALGTPLPEERSALPTVDELRAVFERSNTAGDEADTSSLAFDGEVMF